MKTKNYLLPHNFQKIGWGIFIISFILLLASNYASDTLKLFNKNNNYLPGFILYIFTMFSMYFVAFSREKIEDELIQSVRYSSIVFTVLTGFISYTIILIIFAFNKAINFLPYTTIIFMIVNPITLFILYVLIFRTRLFMFKRGLKNAE
jgi:hypothetical protein